MKVTTFLASARVTPTPLRVPRLSPCRGRAWTFDGLASESLKGLLQDLNYTGSPDGVLSDHKHAKQF